MVGDSSQKNCPGLLTNRRVTSIRPTSVFRLVVDLRLFLSYTKPITSFDCRNTQILKYNCVIIKPSASHSGNNGLLHWFCTISTLMFIRINRLNSSLEQLGGFAFTSSALYITVQVHRSTRIAQRKAIRDQVDQIDWLVSSSGAYDRRNLPIDIPRRRREELEAQKQAEPTMKEILKHRWNKEVEILTRRAYETRWQDVRDTVADGWKAAAQILKRE